MTGNSLLSSGASYRVLNNLDDGTLTLEIGNLKLPNNTYISMKVENQRYSYNESGAMVMRIPSYTSNVAGMSHTITNLDFEYYSRYLNQQAFPMLVMSYEIDGQYNVRVIYSPAYYWGNTVVTDQDGKSYTNSSQSSFYGIQFFHDTKVATFGAFSAKFAENMPAMNMTFKDIPFTLDQYSYNASIDELIPNIGETPYPNYKISDFRMTGTWGGQQTLSFTCTITDTDKETGAVTVKGTYRVVAALSIMPPSTSSNN